MPDKSVGSRAAGPNLEGRINVRVRNSDSVCCQMPRSWNRCALLSVKPLTARNTKICAWRMRNAGPGRQCGSCGRQAHVTSGPATMSKMPRSSRVQHWRMRHTQAGNEAILIPAACLPR